MTLNVAGKRCDDQEDGALTGGPFSALCASMHPGEEEREAGNEEVQATETFVFHTPTLFQGGDSGFRPKCPAIVHVGRVWISSGGGGWT